MELTRSVKIPVKVKNCEVGDQLILGSGFTATCQKVSEDGEYATFCLDQYLDEAVTRDKAQDYMNKVYDETDIFDSVKHRIRIIPSESSNVLRLPYAEEFFGPLDWVVPSGKEQWPLMKNTKNRIAYRQNSWEWGWLMNQHKEFASYFEIVDAYGYSYCFSASYTSGVRPVFRLRNADV